ncbi:Rossmann fold nucleotide-binding protein Smf [Hydrogenimonas sp.]|nr:Rossmann fold nucleotide-binding protein Smf [Hydrogenimonas sp.]
MKQIEFEIEELVSMRKYPSALFYRGNLELLKKPKVSIVGSRRPNQYAAKMTYRVAAALAARGVVVVSGAAMGVDAIAHRGAGAKSTVAVLPNGFGVYYPSVNRSLIEEIESDGLVLSQFEPGLKAAPWSFVVRNETVVALGDVLVVTQADENSGSMKSVEFAKRMGKRIYVLPHRIGESDGTNGLLAEGSAEAIYDIDAFAECFGEEKSSLGDPFLDFCSGHPTYEEVLEKFKERLFEAELEGSVVVRNGRVMPV